MEPRGETETVLFSLVLYDQEKEKGRLGFFEILSHKITTEVASLLPKILATKTPNVVTYNSCQLGFA